MEISKERIEEYKRIYKEKYGEDLTDDEAYDAAHALASFAKLIFDFYIEEKHRKQKLKKNQKDFYWKGMGNILVLYVKELFLLMKCGMTNMGRNA